MVYHLLGEGIPTFGSTYINRLNTKQMNTNNVMKEAIRKAIVDCGELLGDDDFYSLKFDEDGSEVNVDEVDKHIWLFDDDGFHIEGHNLDAA